MKEHIFVYGLFRDNSRNLLGDFVHCGKAWVKGKLYKVNEFYPGMIEGDSKVWGDVYLIDPKVLDQLDEFEGDEYIRTKTRTSTDVECWVYEYKYDTKGIKEVRSGDWMLR
jgi:gamma-glutamylcyclotransferase (GGCT)/AIG2-like uncharacterized protein YtfP